MLGVAVTCSNKQTFIDKIQVTACVAFNIDGWHEDDNRDLPKNYHPAFKYNISVPGRDNSTRSHCLRCLFHLHKGRRPVQIRSRSKSILQEWTCKQDQNYDIFLLQEWTGRISAQSLNSELKMATPPGDEIWAQKCHELDFQVDSILIFNILPPSSSPSPY